MNRFESSACLCDACTDIVQVWQGACEFCQPNCFYFGQTGKFEAYPIELRIMRHAERLRVMDAHSRDRYIRHAMLKFGAKFLSNVVDPTILSNAKQLIQSAWNLAKAWRGK